MRKYSSLHFQKAILRQLDYFTREYSLTYEEAIGVLDIVKHRLLNEANESPLPDESDEGMDANDGQQGFTV